MVNIDNDIVDSLLDYGVAFHEELEGSEYFFVKHTGKPLSDQSIRRMIKNYSEMLGLEVNITPNIFRSTYYA